MRLKEVVERASAAPARLQTSREALRDLSNAERDVRSAWARGQPVQRRMQTVMVPASFKAVTGQDMTIMNRESARSIVDLCDTARHSKAKTFLAAVKLHLGSDPFGNARAYLTSAYTYLAAREFGAPNVFTLNKDLAERLIETDRGNIGCDAIRPPFPGFYVEMPPGSLEMLNGISGWHPVSLIGISEAERGGSRVLCSTYYGEPLRNASSSLPAHLDDTVQSIYQYMSPGAVPYEEMAEDEYATLAPTIPFVRWHGVEHSGELGIDLLWRIVENFCLYLSSPNADIQPAGGGRETWESTLEHAEACRTSPHLKRRSDKRFTLWDAGRNAKALRASPVDVVVRGHWRQQAHGPQWSLRKVIWVEPHIRLPTGDVAPGHDYIVENGGKL